jgi:hypothetical protein
MKRTRGYCGEVKENEKEEGEWGRKMKRGTQIRRRMRTRCRMRNEGNKGVLGRSKRERKGRRRIGKENEKGNTNKEKNENKV